MGACVGAKCYLSVQELRKKDEESRAPQSPLRAYPQRPKDLSLGPTSYRFMVPPNIAMLGTKALHIKLWGTPKLYSNHSICLVTCYAHPKGLLILLCGCRFFYMTSRADLLTYVVSVSCLSKILSSFLFKPNIGEGR